MNEHQDDHTLQQDLQHSAELAEFALTLLRTLTNDRTGTILLTFANGVVKTVGMTAKSKEEAVQILESLTKAMLAEMKGFPEHYWTNDQSDAASSATFETVGNA